MSKNSSWNRDLNWICIMVFSFLVLWVGSLPCYAALDFTDLKGFEENVKMKEEYEYLSPFHAFSMARLGLLTNFYRFPNAMPETRTDRDSSWDPTEQLIQIAFNNPASENSVFFKTNPLAASCAKFMMPSSLGIVLAHLDSLKANKARVDPTAVTKSLLPIIESDPDFVLARDAASKEETKIKADMEKRAEEIDPSHGKSLNQHKNEISEAEKQHKSLKDRRYQLQSGGACEVGTPEWAELNQINQELENINQILKTKMEAITQIKTEDQKSLSQDEKYNQLKNELALYHYDSKYLRVFLERVLRSWKSEGSENSIFPAHFTEQILLALAWLNTPIHDKKTFMKLYGSLPQSFHHLGAGTWLNSTEGNYYSPDDFSKLMKDLDDMHSKLKKSPERARFNLNADSNADKESAISKLEHLLNHPYQLAFLSFADKYYNSDVVPILDYRRTDFTDSNGRRTNYSDCMDYSYLNFLFAIGRNDKNQFDPSILKGKGCEPSEKLLKFSKKNSSLDSFSLSEAHNAWADVISELGSLGVTYVNGKVCELDTHVDNIFNLTNHLLCPGLNLGKDQTREMKMNQLCNLLSHDGLELDWRVETSESGKNKSHLNSLNSNATIVFSINGLDKFKWKITTGHAEIIPHEAGSRGVWYDLNQELEKQIEAKDDVLQPKSKVLMWLNSSRGVNSLPVKFFDASKGGDENNPGLPWVYSLSMSGMNSKISFLRALRYLSTSNKPIRVGSILRVLSTIPENDVYSFRKAIEVLYDWRNVPELQSFFSSAEALFKSEDIQMDAVRSALAEKDLRFLVWLTARNPALFKNGYQHHFFVNIYESIAERLVDNHEFEALLLLAKIEPHILEDQKSEGGKSVFFLAMEMGDLSLANWLLKEHPNQFKKQMAEFVSFYRTPLESALRNGHWNTAKWCLEHFPDALLKVEYSRDVFNLASKKRQEDFLKEFISRYPRHVDQFGKSAIEYAAEESYWELVDWALNQGDTSLFKENNLVAAQLAETLARGGKLDLLRRLKEANPTSIEMDRSYPLSAYVLEGKSGYQLDKTHWEVISWLMNTSPKAMLGTGRTETLTLEKALEFERVDVVEWYREKHPHVFKNEKVMDKLHYSNALYPVIVDKMPELLDIENNKGEIFAHYAFYQSLRSDYVENHDKMIDWYLTHKPELLLKEDNEGKNPFLNAGSQLIEKLRRKNPQLVEKGVLHQDHGGNTVLHRLARSCTYHQEDMRALSRTYPQLLKVRNTKQETPLGIISQCRDSGSSSLYIELKALLNESEVH